MQRHEKRRGRQGGLCLYSLAPVATLASLNPEADPPPSYSPGLRGPSLHLRVGALGPVHHSSDKVLHPFKVGLVNAARAINQEGDVNLLICTLCREGERNQKRMFEGTSLVVRWLRILPANAGDMSLIPDPGRFHMPRGN